MENSQFFKDKKLKMNEIYNSYCHINSELYSLDNVYCYGDFGGQDGPVSDRIFMYFEGEEELYSDFYSAFLKTVIEKNSLDLFLESKACDECNKAVLSLLKFCEYLEVTQEKDNIFYVKFPVRPSYEELLEIEYTFLDVCEILRIYS